MRIYWLAVGMMAVCTFTSHAAKITSLKIEGNTVVFSQSGTKAAASPACAASQPAKWGLQLLTDADRATYAALVAAAGSNMDIVVTSAQKCVEGTAFEQVKSVEVQPVVAVAGVQGMKIVAVGATSRWGGGVSSTLLSPNGKPYMVSGGSGDSVYVSCYEDSVQFTTYDTSTKYTLCLLK